VPGQIATLLDQRASHGFVGRARERELLTQLLAPDPSILIVHLHGIGGVGKSTLLDMALTDARAAGATVVRLDCRTMEPTERGFLLELGAAVGAASDRVDELAARLGGLGPLVVLALDNYEVYGLMDTWLRQVFLPSLDANLRVIVAGREPPLPTWFASPAWQGLFRSLPLGPLDGDDALELLRRCEVSDEAADDIARIARGHPLALKLAASALTERPDLGLAEAAMQRVVEELTRVFLADIRDPLTRRVLDAASVVRRVTRPLLAAMLPDAAPDDAFERLRTLAFVETSREGLVLHEAVRQATAANLRAVDPARYREHRQTAWRQLRAEMSASGSPEVWRYTADALYLIENHVVREAFFPSGAQRHAVEPARPEDGDAIRAICARQEPPESTGRLMTWWTRAPETFSVVWDREGIVVGFYSMFDPATMPRELLADDPITRLWARHVREHPVPKGDSVLFLRRWLDAESGEGPSPIQAAAWLDIKRSYMAMRPQLRRVYATVQDLATWGPIISRLRFRPLESPPLELDGVLYHSAVLDFGPSSVDGWLGKLLSEELGIQETVVIDAEAGEVRLDGRRIALTPLELGLIGHLWSEEGRVVSRGALLREVWGTEYQGGSNLVDSVVRSLRKKLGDDASSIETVRGYGYRFRGS
jgi:Transcriptional regulatory protein, C terminal